LVLLCKWHRLRRLGESFQRIIGVTVGQLDEAGCLKLMLVLLGL
jgi:hypothetical protein